MPRYLIERTIPGAGTLSPADLTQISGRSCSVLRELGPEIQWIESFVTDDKIYCVYLAPSEDMIRQHAARGGFPVDHIRQLRTVIGPVTAEGVG